jgi:hypothetical protein
MKYLDTDTMTAAEESKAEAASCATDAKDHEALLAACAVFAKAVIATLVCLAKRPLLPNAGFFQPVYNDGFYMGNGDEICFNAFDCPNGVRLVRVIYWQGWPSGSVC